MKPTPTTQQHAPAPIFTDILDMVGNTPMIELNRLDAGPCRLLGKMECLNPGNSIKDRIAISMIDAAEQDGSLKAGGHIVEATAGNTGIALALVGTQRGYDVTVVVPDKMSEGKISHLRAMGAEVIMARSDVEKGHPEYYQEVAQRIADDRGSFYVNQFSNDANVQVHYDTTAKEIWEQTEGKIDAFVAGVGSGGTVTGVGRYLKERNPDVKIVLADPCGSVLAPLVNEGREVPPGSWLVEGIGEDFIPDILELDVIDEAIHIEDKDAFLTARTILRKEGILAGSSSGTLVAAALEWCRRQTEPKTVVTFICDNGAKYLDKMFNDFWMMDQGFIERTEHGNLRDLIGRRHTRGEDYTLKPQMPMIQAFKLMRLYDVSQIAVVDDDGTVSGIIDESDVLVAVSANPDSFKHPVAEFMTRKLVTVAPEDDIHSLLPIFENDKVAIVADGEQFFGLITKIDLITYLRKQLPS
ncbi:MAG: cystathionine beta-synthase [Phycisphaerae bacterium]|nr:cystathionine beta-synthase [Phycisphaerae bacterium]|tara:strand:- start:1385 stop:2791 length:1407 start_codon:yes stop_codon:yes gene_type:complete